MSLQELFEWFKTYMGQPNVVAHWGMVNWRGNWSSQALQGVSKDFPGGIRCPQALPVF